MHKHIHCRIPINDTDITMFENIKRLKLWKYIVIIFTVFKLKTQIVFYYVSETEY